MLRSPRKGPWLRYQLAIVDDYSHSGARGVEFHGIGSSFPHLIVQPSLSLPR